MLYYNFKNYEEFKERFGIKRDANGKLIRKNKVLLAWAKNKELFRLCVHKEKIGEWDPYRLINFTHVCHVEVYVKSLMKWTTGPHALHLNGKIYWSPKYKTDDARGIPEDGSIGFIRYQNMEREGKVYKMKAGKMYKHLMDNCYYSQVIAEEVKNYMCEILTQEWISYQQRFLPDNYDLYVDSDFEYIYDMDNYLDGDNFGSCMADKGFHRFYEKANAEAACLCTPDGEIAARCIIFNKVVDSSTCEVYRLAERQYASHGNVNYMRMLINMLIKEGHIDGFKRIGAGCGDADAFVLNDGTPLEGHRLYIEMNLDANDQISYMDSFKYYYPNEKKAWNVAGKGCFKLDSTDGEIGGVNYDSYHECNTFNDTVPCRYKGEWWYVDVERLGDFVEIDKDFYHNYEVRTCTVCGCIFPIEDGFYSKLTEKHYCCNECLCEAEEIFREEQEDAVKERAQAEHVA